MACAYTISHYLEKPYFTQPSIQYNAIMLIRILSDNPGSTFMRGFDKDFVETVRVLLVKNKDGGTQQILRETLDALEAGRAGHDEGAKRLMSMWRSQKGQKASLSFTTTGSYQQRFALENGRSGSFGNSQPAPAPRTLPPPAELASRIEEARNTAKILLQLIASTPPSETLSNELLKEFSDRCQSALKSMQQYIDCENPAPDHDTLLTLIETTEQLSLASSRYQRSILSARRAAGVSDSPSPSPGAVQADGYYGNSPAAAQGQGESLFGAAPSTTSPPPLSDGYGGLGQTRSTESEAYQAPMGPPPTRTSMPTQPAPSDPFQDPVEGSYASPQQRPDSRDSAYRPYSATGRPPLGDQRDTVALENAYAETPIATEPPPLPNGGSYGARHVAPSRPEDDEMYGDGGMPRVDVRGTGGFRNSTGKAR